MSTAAKDIIYIDIDDEITSIIEKVQTAEHRIVALVLPKRAAVLQSVVNMKLLKRKADEGKKHVVLITSEAGLLPLAGAVGLHVAKTLQTKPAVPPAPKLATAMISVDEADAPEVEDKPLDASKPIGVLAGLRGRNDDEEETIEVDNTDDKTPEELEEPVKKPGNKKLKVPNFGKFRNRLFIGGAALILILILWYMAAFVMPKATIVIKTDTSNETADLTFTTDPEIDEVNLEEKILPSAKEELKKTDSEKVTATGEKDNGTKASGTITIRNCEDSSSRSVSAGTTFTSGGKSYRNTSAFTVPGGTFSGGGSNCTSSSSSAIPVEATAAGESYNQAAANNYTSSSNGLQGDFRISGSAMSGGTTKVVKVLSQKDFDEAKKKLEERLDNKVTDELSEKLQERGYYVLGESLITGTPEYTSSPKVDEEASEATVTVSTTYTLIGVKEDHLKELVRESVKDAVDEDREMIQSTGLDEAVIRLTDKQTSGKATASMQAIVVIGPKLDLEDLKKEVAGKKKSQTQSLLLARPGVKDVEVSYSPFWVFSTPGKTGKINITLEEANPNND